MASVFWDRGIDFPYPGLACGNPVLTMRRMEASPSYLRRNYVLSALEGGFFMGGMAFLSMESVMPAMIHDLGGPGWSVSLVPVLFMLGFCWPQVLGAVVVERFRRMKPLVVGMGAIQRLPYLLTGLFFLTAGDNHPEAVVVLAVITPFIMSTLGGLQGSAYFEMVTRIVPVRRTASMWAIRNVMMGISGILAGIVIKSLLESYPGIKGYGILHLITFFMMLVSLILMTGIRETNIPEEEKPDPASFRTGFAAFWREWKGNPSLVRFIITRMLFMMVFAAVPFASVRAVVITGSGAGILGLLVLTQMIGFITGNVFTGLLGDRLGVRLPMLLGRALLLLGLVTLPFAAQPWHFMLVYGFLGIGIGSAQVGDLTMVIDFAPGVRRKFFYAVMSLLAVPGLLAAFMTSAALQYLEMGFYLACLVSITGILASLFFLFRLDDPRRSAIGSPSVTQ